MIDTKKYEGREIDKLLPCPFCGGEAYYVDRSHTHAGVDLIMCGDCGCRMYGGNEEKWNNRDAIITAEARIKELEEALTPFAKFRNEMGKMGGNFPKTGTLYGLNVTPTSGVVLLVEDFTIARAALKGKE